MLYYTIFVRRSNFEKSTYIWNRIGVLFFIDFYLWDEPANYLDVFNQDQLIDVLKSIKNSPIKWILWSTVGFGLFYAPLSFASEYGASWLVAGTWQITIIAGALMSPLFFKYIETESGIVKVRNKIPKKTLIISSIILIGIFLMLFGEAEHISFLKSFLVIIPVIIAAFSYPLGNRKMMEFCSEDLNTIQRVFGMTLCSMPFWIILSIYGISSVGFPSTQQIFQTFLVAIFSGVIATILFFKATDIVSKDAYKLAVIESTQSGEVIFTALGGIFILNDRVPGVFGVIGIVLVVFGMILNSLSRENSN